MDADLRAGGMSPEEIEKAMEEKTKTCSGCGKEKGFDEFSLNNANKDGHEYKCKACFRDMRKKKKKKEGKSDILIFGERPTRPSATATPALAEVLYLQPDLIRGIKRAVAKEVIEEFIEFIERRYA